jgi:hypothetical protein
VTISPLRYRLISPFSGLKIFHSRRGFKPPAAQADSWLNKRSSPVRWGALGILLFLLLSLNASLASAQSGDNYVGTVIVDSAFVRALPDFDAETTASVFKNERLEVISRNLDGTWFKVRRVGRLNELGWVFGEVMEWDFAPELLPLGDFTTGVTGPNPLTQPTEFAIFIQEGVYLRDQPLRRGNTITNIPALVTVPVLGRNQDGSWLYVNYLGNQGWMVAFTGRPGPNMLGVPQPPNLPPLETPLVNIIPVELQEAQIDRLRAFINERHGYAVGLETFWWRVFRGEIMPCDVPPELSYYPYSEDDVRQLPELQRYAPRLRTAVDYLNTARDPLLSCGIVSPDITITARNGAINARVIFDATLDALDNLEENIVQARR